METKRPIKFNLDIFLFLINCSIPNVNRIWKTSFNFELNFCRFKRPLVKVKLHHCTYLSNSNWKNNGVAVFKVTCLRRFDFLLEKIYSYLTKRYSLLQQQSHLRSHLACSRLVYTCAKVVPSWCVSSSSIIYFTLSKRATFSFLFHSWQNASKQSSCAFGLDELTSIYFNYHYLLEAKHLFSIF